MAVTMNQFKCANGHSFEANAKLRTRCPDCGVSTKRSFEKGGDSTDTPAGVSVTGSVEPKEPVITTEPKPKTGPVLVRQGRPRMPVRKSATKTVAKKKPPFKPVGARVSAGLVKSHTIKTRGTMPTIKRRPVKTAIARGIKGHEQVTPYWHDVAAKYGIG